VQPHRSHNCKSGWRAGHLCCLALSCLASPCLNSPRLASPRFTSPCLALPCLEFPCLLACLALPRTNSAVFNIAIDVHHRQPIGMVFNIASTVTSHPTSSSRRLLFSTSHRILENRGQHRSNVIDVDSCLPSFQPPAIWTLPFSKKEAQAYRGIDMGATALHEFVTGSKRCIEDEAVMSLDLPYQGRRSGLRERKFHDFSLPQALVQVSTIHLCQCCSRRWWQELNRVVPYPPESRYRGPSTTCNVRFSYLLDVMSITRSCLHAHSRSSLLAWAPSRSRPVCGCRT
jgi:hypothetical protein